MGEEKPLTARIREAVLGGRSEVGDTASSVLRSIGRGESIAGPAIGTSFEIDHPVDDTPTSIVVDHDPDAFLRGVRPR